MRRLAVLYLVVFVGFVGYALMITVFTPLVMGSQGLLLPAGTPRPQRSIVLGVLLSLYPLGQLLGAPVLGGLSDRHGRRPVLLVSLAVGVVGYVVVSVAIATANLPLLMVASFVTGLFEANVTIAQSAIADVADGVRRGVLFGYVYLASSLAYVVGPLAGGPLADPDVIPWARDWVPFGLVAVLVALVLVLAVISMSETHVPVATSGTGPSLAQGLAANVLGLLDVVRDVRLRPYYLANALFYLAVFGFFRTYPLYLVDHFHLSLGGESLFVAWVAVPIVLSNLWLTPLLFRRSSVRQVLVGAGVLAGVGAISVPLPPEQWTLWITLFVTGLGAALLLAFCAARISAAAEAQQQGRVLGNNQSLQVGAEVVSGLIGGVLAAITSGTPLVIFGVVALLAAALTRRQREPAAPGAHAA